MKKLSYKSVATSLALSLTMLALPVVSSATEVEKIGNPLLKSQISVQALNEAGLKAVVGTGVTADNYGVNAISSINAAYNYAYYARYTAPSNSSTEILYYSLAAAYSGLGSFYSGLASYYSFLGQ
jgi:hypothetical protein